ncbi:SpoIIIAH-like family protein [Brevibacillus sp. SYP-B805]|uniref:SpoIIIAH-like family protein n=1 Tax=Brevibacillus sp. SYP-B805 TaxID=1578199 RepID=UPI0013EB84A3|nr:SpoIIIAH-like family protein [Brevibacillus sp. SYP-B805]NGQ94713.1 SpoIIIAH-like family protein [Brevibacillus sp. SYP-B805]
MVLRKQTVWLLTMLAVMVVLSGYYLVKGPNEQVPAVSEEQQDSALGDVQVDTKQTDQPAPEAAPAEADTATLETPAPKSSEQKEAATLADTPSDVFQGYKLKRDALLQKDKDEQMAIMMNPEATPQAVAEAKAKYEELSTVEQATMTIEEMLKASGYKDAVVSVQDQKVTVIVQKENLTAGEVVDIIAQVKQHLNVSGSNVSVQYKAL